MCSFTAGSQQTMSVHGICACSGAALAAGAYRFHVGWAGGRQHDVSVGHARARRAATVPGRWAGVGGTKFCKFKLTASLEFVDTKTNNMRLKIITFFIF